MEAHHHGGHINEDVIQCVIFDGNDDDAKLMGPHSGAPALILAATGL